MAERTRMHRRSSTWVAAPPSSRAAVANLGRRWPPRLRRRARGWPSSVAISSGEYRRRSDSGSGGAAIGVACDVLDRASLERSREQVTSAFGPADILINAAGGNSPAATTSAEQSFFDLDAAAVNQVFALNFTGDFQTCQVFGRVMADRGQGCIVNVTSMSALRPLTRIAAYSAAKAAVANFTQWLAVHMAQEYSPTSGSMPWLRLFSDRAKSLSADQCRWHDDTTRAPLSAIRQRAAWASQQTWRARCSGW